MEKLCRHFALLVLILFICCPSLCTWQVDYIDRRSALSTLLCVSSGRRKIFLILINSITPNHAPLNKSRTLSPLSCGENINYCFIRFVFPQRRQDFNWTRLSFFCSKLEFYRYTINVNDVVEEESAIRLGRTPSYLGIDVMLGPACVSFIGTWRPLLYIN